MSSRTEPCTTPLLRIPDGEKAYLETQRTFRFSDKTQTKSNT